MSRIIKFFTTIRNNWKKSVVGAAAFSYGVSYSIESYDTEQLMRQYSELAAKYGDEPLPTNIPPRRVTVILNPVAKKRKAKKLFEKYCEPLLHLAGIAVTIIQTEREGQARSLIENLNTPTDAIIVAGGDGTLLDVVTGLMRKYNANSENVKKCPISILPLGQTNRMADTLYNDYEELADVHRMADAVMAVIRGTTKTVDVVQVQPLDDSENDIKPVYAVGEIEWGAWRDARSRINKYWYWGSLRRYVTYVFTGYKRDVNWECNATIKYSEPCHGCSRCYEEQRYTEERANVNRRWWQAFVPRRITAQTTGPDYSKVTNEKCGQLREIPISTTELHLSTSNIEKKDPQRPPSIILKLGPEQVSYTSYIAEGWRRVNGEKAGVNKSLEAKQIEIMPNKAPNFEDKEQMFSIDNEEFELKPLKIRLLPKSVTMFCSQLEN